MKRIIKLSFLFAFFEFVLIGCNETTTSCNHDTTSIIIDKEATCEEKGSKHIECTTCHETLKTEEIEALGHDKMLHERKEATCSEVGYDAYYTCSRCDYTTYKELPILKHIESDWIVDKEATCEEKGSKHIECNECHETLKTEEVESLGHDKVLHEGKEATCSEKGYEAYYTCSRCDYTTYKELPILKHIESDWIVDDEATCEGKGSKHIECTICHEILETEEIKAIGHNYINDVCTTCGSTKLPYTIAGEYVYFGYYPQTLKEDNVNILYSLDDGTDYYLGDDGNRYAKVYASPYKQATMYFDNNQKIVNNNMYYFKVEPVKWKIISIDETNYKLVTDKIIDKQYFNTKTYKDTIDGETIYPNNYEYSSIRQWLNDTFYNKAFSTIAKNYINTTLVDNSVSSTGTEINSCICNDTYDKVYLLSVKDVKESKDTCNKYLTDYAKAVGCWMNAIDKDYYNIGRYWLRSPRNYNTDDSNYKSYYLEYTGDVYSFEINRNNIGVAPALTIKVDK